MNAADTCTSQRVLSNNVVANNDSGIHFAASIATPVVYTRTNNTFTGNVFDVSGAPAQPLTPLTPK
jgi:nitrous oxidase accessory protein NosD